MHVDSLFSHGISWLCALGVIGLHKEQSTQTAKGYNSAAGVQTSGCLKYLSQEYWTSCNLLIKKCFSQVMWFAKGQ